MLALIGAAWAGGDRIHDDGDFVRLEIAQALASGKKLIPVLVDGASMPARHDLPADISDLGDIQAWHLRTVTFARDADDLAQELLGEPTRLKSEPDPATARLKRHSVSALLGTIAATLLVVGLGLLHALLTGGASVQSTLGSAEAATAVIVTAAAIGFAIPFWLRRRLRATSPSPSTRTRTRR